MLLGNLGVSGSQVKLRAVLLLFFFYYLVANLIFQHLNSAVILLRHEKDQLDKYM